MLKASEITSRHLLFSVFFAYFIFFVYPNWALEIYQQANKRLHRQGQEHPVIVHQLVVQGGMDEAVLSALHDKGDAQDALMQALKARIEKYKRS